MIKEFFILVHRADTRRIALIHDEPSPVFLRREQAVAYAAAADRADVQPLTLRDYTPPWRQDYNNVGK